MRKMFRDAARLAMDLLAAMLSDLAPSGSLSTLSGNRSAAPLGELARLIWYPSDAVSQLGNTYSEL